MGKVQKGTECERDAQQLTLRTEMLTVRIRQYTVLRTIRQYDAFTK